MAARKSKRQKLKRHKCQISPVRKELLRSGYVAGFIEALRLQNGMPSGVTFSKTRSERTNWAQRAFETHSLDPARGVIANETMKPTKAGAPPNFRFVGRLAKSYLPEKFVRVSIPDQIKHLTNALKFSAQSATDAEESKLRFGVTLIDSHKNPGQRFEFSQMASPTPVWESRETLSLLHNCLKLTGSTFQIGTVGLFPISPKY